MWLEIIGGTYVVGSYIYHRLTEPGPPRLTNWVDIPQTDEGAAFPLLFGRCRVQRPILVETGKPGLFDVDDWGFNSVVDAGVDKVRGIDMLFVLGIPIEDGITRIHTVWAGETKMHNSGAVAATPKLADLTGNGNHEEPTYLTTPTLNNLRAGVGLLEFLNGNSSQQLVNSDASESLTFVADRLTDLGLFPAKDAAQRTGLRGVASAFMFGGWPLGLGDIIDPEGEVGDPVGDPPTPDVHLRWIIGDQERIPSYSFEVSSYPSDQRYPAFIGTAIGDDMNPADVIAAVLCDKFGKLGLDPDEVIDQHSFGKVGAKLLSEGLGYSRCWDSRVPAREIIDDVLRTIDGGLYRDRTTGKYVLKLVRADYDPNALALISPDNCDAIEDVTVTGWVDKPVRVRVKFTHREDGYREGSVVAHDQAAADKQEGETDEIVLSFPGICTTTAAEHVAAREQNARTQPLLRCKAIVRRGFLDHNPLDVVGLAWPDLNIPFRVMRIGKISLGPASSNTLVMDLIEDAFFVYRRRVSVLPPVVTFPTPPVFETEVE